MGTAGVKPYMNTQYRLNYGNGQVGANGPLAEVRRAYEAQRDFDRTHHQSSAGLRIERYMGEGEWLQLKGGRS